jgi:large subunit ribosomal protein L10
MAEEVKEQPQEVEEKNDEANEVAEEGIEEPKVEIKEDKPEVKAKPKKSNTKTHVSKAKLDLVKNLAESMKSHRTIMIVSIKSLPGPQLQKIKKDIRDEAEVKVAKKSILLRAIDDSSIAEMQVLKEHIVADSAVLFSNKEGFELAGWLLEHRNPISAKAGQTANEDINVEPGPTDLMPGPDISALGAVGLKVAVEDGKIAIKEPHIILKQDGEVTENIASVLQKLGIKPFMIGLTPNVVYDTEDKRLYVGIKIDKEEALTNLVTANSKALGFAQAIEYYCKETIAHFLAKANAHAQGLEKLSPAEEKKEEVKEETKTEEPSEEKKEEPKEEEVKEEVTEDTEDKSKEEQN